MTQILKKVYDVDPNNTDAVKEAITSFFQHLTKRTDNERYTWLQALENIISRYPKFCSSHKNNIETYLSYYLDSDDFFQVISAAKCIHAAQQIRFSQDKTATPKTCWKDQINLLCKAAHILIDVLFENALDMYRGISESNTASSGTPFAIAINNIKKVPSNVNKNKLLKLRLRNILIFIQAMLVEVYPVEKSIEPQIILDLILRLQSVTSDSNNKSDFCEIKVEALRTLDALILCLGSNLMPFSPLVIRFVMQTLRWSRDNISEGANKVRCTAYGSLRGWLGALRCHRAPAGRDAWEDQLTEHIGRDVTPDKKVIQLTIGNKPVKNLSKKARRKQANAMVKESSIAAHTPGERNKIQPTEFIDSEVTMAALNCAEVFLTVCGRFLKSATHKVFQERLVRGCFSADTCEDRVLLAMLRSLEACRKSTPSGVPPPTQYCLHLYSTLLNSQNEQISKFCSQAMLDIRLHLHCSPPSLNFDVEAPDTAQHGPNKRKKISEKNRAALETLLGTERMSEISEEIIVPDEPSPKKPRIEVDDEKISISSSITSVELSDDSDDCNIQEVEDSKEPNEITIVEQPDKINVKSKDDPTEHVEVEIVEANLNDSRYNKNKIIIHEAPTQLPLNISNDTFDGEDRPLSMEIGYDYPNTRSERVTLLEKDEGDNLPSTNETDDIHITCGQVVKSSQEMEPEEEVGDEKNEISDVNGVDADKVVENGHCSANVESEHQNENVSKEVEKIPTKDGISVDDMLADFVDEVNEEGEQT